MDSVSSCGLRRIGMGRPNAPRNATFENLSDRSVLKVWRTRSQLKALGLLPQDGNDDVDEMAWLDMGSADPTQPSNLTDSEAFSALGYEFRGKATNDGTKTRSNRHHRTPCRPNRSSRRQDAKWSARHTAASPHPSGRS